MQGKATCTPSGVSPWIPSPSLSVVELESQTSPLRICDFGDGLVALGGFLSNSHSIAEVKTHLSKAIELLLMASVTATLLLKIQTM